MYQISFYVPESHLEIVRNALFDAGAGRIGLYDRCAWQTCGEGSFRPLEGSSPTLGSPGEVERVVEFKVEMVCADEFIEAVIAALLTAHPYETPAYQCIRLADF